MEKASHPGRQWRGPQPSQEPYVDKRGIAHDTCAQCGDRFFLSPKAQEAFQRHGYPLPRRCFNCRKNKHRHDRERFCGNVLVLEDGAGIILGDDGVSYAFTLGTSRGMDMLAKSDRVTFQKSASQENDSRLPTAVAVRAE